ncbi:MAG TPA: hypothetical protein VF278_12400 [Pirellulales bacterium]
MINRLKDMLVSRPLDACKAAGRWFERRLARRLSERYADEITQFTELRRAIHELTARLEKQEAYHWDHVALARRLAALEDHLGGLSDLVVHDETEAEENVVCLPLTENRAATATVGQLRGIG